MRGVANLYMSDHQAAPGGLREEDTPIKHLEYLSGWLDNRFRIPGTNFRIGFDSLLGIIPGLGDAATGAMSIFIVAEGYRLGVRKRTLIKMIKNVAVDTVVGSIPLIGDIFDVVYKANLKNLEHIRRDLTAQNKL